MQRSHHKQKEPMNGVTHEITIDPPQGRPGLRGRLARLHTDYSMKAAALRLAAEILDEEDMRVAQEAAPKKFLDAINQRDEAMGRNEPAPAPKPAPQERRVKVGNGELMNRVMAVFPETGTIKLQDLAEKAGVENKRAHGAVHAAVKNKLIKKVGVGTYTRIARTNGAMPGQQPQMGNKERVLAGFPPSAGKMIKVDELASRTGVQKQQVYNALTVLVQKKLVRRMGRVGSGEYAITVRGESAQSKLNGAAKPNGRTAHGYRPIKPATKAVAKKSKPSQVGEWLSRREAAITSIRGPRLSLFVLEHLTPEQGRTAVDMMQALAEKGTRIGGLNPVFGMLSTKQLVTRAADGYQLTAQGHDYAVNLRKQLEANGQCVPGGYFAPSDYLNPRQEGVPAQTDIPLSRDWDDVGPQETQDAQH